MVTVQAKALEGHQEGVLQWHPRSQSLIMYCSRLCLCASFTTRAVSIEFRIILSEVVFLGEKQYFILLRATLSIEVQDALYIAVRQVPDRCPVPNVR
jgi:hypothetical protein